MEQVQLSGPSSCPVGDIPLPRCLLMAGRVKPPQQKGCLLQRLQGKPKGPCLALLCRQGDQPGGACLCQPPPLCPQGHGRASPWQMVCRSGSLYLVTPNKRKVAAGRVFSLFCACCVGSLLLGQGSWGQQGAVVTAGSPCRAQRNSRAVKPTQHHTVSTSLPAPLIPGATMNIPAMQDWEMG